MVLLLVSKCLGEIQVSHSEGVDLVNQGGVRLVEMFISKAEIIVSSVLDVDFIVVTC